jgi:hypothetical protein
VRGDPKKRRRSIGRPKGRPLQLDAMRVLRLSYRT